MVGRRRLELRTCAVICPERCSSRVGTTTVRHGVMCSGRGEFRHQGDQRWGLFVSQSRTPSNHSFDALSIDNLEPNGYRIPRCPCNHRPRPSGLGAPGAPPRGSRHHASFLRSQAVTGVVPRPGIRYATRLMTFDVEMRHGAVAGCSFRNANHCATMGSPNPTPQKNRAHSPTASVWQTEWGT